MGNQFTVNDKINLLFNLLLKANGKPYSNEEVFRATGLQPATLSAVRLKKSNNPTFTTLQDLSRFFGIPLSYFDCDTEEECVGFIAQFRTGISKDEIQEMNTTVRAIAIKAMNMSDTGQREALRLLEWMETADRVLHERQQAASASG